MKKADSYIFPLMAITFVILVLLMACSPSPAFAGEVEELTPEYEPQEIYDTNPMEQGQEDSPEYEPQEENDSDSEYISDSTSDLPADTSDSQVVIYQDSELSDYQQQILSLLTSIDNHLASLIPDSNPEQEAAADHEEQEQREQEQQEYMETLTSIRDSLVVLSASAAPGEDNPDPVDDVSADPDSEVEPEEEPSSEEPPSEQPSEEPSEEPSEPATEDELPEIGQQDFYRLVLAALIVLCAWPVLRFFFRFLSSFLPV